MTKRGGKKQKWQRERKAALLVACKGIARRVQRGYTAAAAIAYYSRRMDGRPLRAAPGRALSLSESTLRRIYFRWKRAGEAALELGYVTMEGTTLPRWAVQSYLLAVLHSTSRAEAQRLVRERWERRHPGATWPFSKSAFYRATPKELRTAASACHRARTAAQKAEAELRFALLGEKSLQNAPGRFRGINTQPRGLRSVCNDVALVCNGISKGAASSKSLKTRKGGNHG